MRQILIFILMMLLLMSSCSKSRKAREDIVIGSKNFTESIILAESIAQLIEASTGNPVVRKFNLGGTNICHEALVAGQLDIYPEYTGTALVAILKRAPERDPKTVYQLVRQSYEKEFGVT